MPLALTREDWPADVIVFLDVMGCLTGGWTQYCGPGESAKAWI